MLKKQSSPRLRNKLGKGSLLDLPLLDYMGFAMEATMKWKMGDGGGTHPSPTALGLGISAPHLPKISKFCLGLGGGTKMFYPPRQDYRRFKIPSFTSQGHSPVCGPMATLFLAELWVIHYHLGNLGHIMCFPNYASPYILAISYNARKRFFRALTASLRPPGSCLFV